MATYAYTPHIWPMLASAALVTVLAAYGWRRRSRPGALPFACMALFALPWLAGEALKLAAVAAPTKIFWFKFQGVWLLAIVTSELCFALEYANHGRWVTRRTIALLALPLLIVTLLMLTNGAHHLMWLDFSVERVVRPVRGTGLWIITGYGYLLGLITSLVFVGLFVRSPLHRRPVALCLCGHVAVRVAFLLDLSGRNPLEPVGATPVALAFVFTMYGLALFYFRMFDIVSVARRTVIEQMREGMLVLDGRRRVVDLNPAAEEILGIQLRGNDIGQVLAEASDACGRLDVAGTAPAEIRLETVYSGRAYELRCSPLTDRHGFSLGYLVLFHDRTDQRQAQEQLVEHQRALAMMEERNRVARELHDDLGQVLGYVKMQVQAARDLLSRDRRPEVGALLGRLATVLQDAHGDVRAYILAARAGSPGDAGFLSALRQYLGRFRETYGIAAELNPTPELTDETLEPTVGVQLLRIVQEALSNVRKHARASGVCVRLGLCDGHAQAIVADDGVGFDPALLETAGGQKFGLRFMRERAEGVGGSVQIHSAPGEGTQVIISVPLRKGLP